MDWKEQLNKAAAALRQVAESDRVKNLTAKARQTAADLTRRAKQGALSAADAYVEANSDTTALRIRYLNADISIMSPSDGLQIARPHAGALVFSDGAGNGLVINVGGDKARLAETVGVVKLLSDTTFDLGSEDGVNVVVLKS
jgi:hypothetical protein